VVIAVFEGDTDLPVVRKLTRDAGLSISVPIDCGGKSQLDAELSGYNQAAKGSPWFVLRDLDDDAPCAGALLRQREFQPASWMCLRIAVRELEAWLLADAEGVVEFFKVAPSQIPLDPDGEADPTRSLVDLVRRSRSSSLRKAMVPKPGGHAAVGPLYEAKIIEFGELHWDLDRACRRSESLRKAREALRALARRWRTHVGGG
jgi:hypothetical protein